MSRRVDLGWGQRPSPRDLGLGQVVAPSHGALLQRRVDLGWGQRPSPRDLGLGQAVARSHGALLQRYSPVVEAGSDVVFNVIYQSAAVFKLSVGRGLRRRGGRGGAWGEWGVGGAGAGPRAWGGAGGGARHCSPVLSAPLCSRGPRGSGG